MKPGKYQIEIAGESALIVYFNSPQSTNLSSEISIRVQAATDKLSVLLGQGLIELVPSYASLLVVFDPFVFDHFQIKQQIHRVIAGLDIGRVNKGQVIELPVYYGEEVGPDLPRIAELHGIPVAEVIERHQSQTYQVFTIGFAPGFAYLGEVDEKIAAPRLSTPRAKVPKGAVAIADRQTAIYPDESPGGWNIIGRCPMPMFSPNAEPVMPVSVGDTVSFRAIDKSEFMALGGDLS